METAVEYKVNGTENHSENEDSKNIVFIKNEVIDIKQELTKEDHVEVLKKLQELQNEKTSLESQLESLKSEKKELEKDLELKDKVQKEYISDANKEFVFRSMSLDLYADFDENKLKWIDTNGNLKKEEEGIPEDYRQISFDQKIVDEEEFAHGFTKSQLISWWNKILYNFEDNTVEGLHQDDANLVEQFCYEDAVFCNIIRNHQNNPHNKKPTIEKVFYKNILTRIKEIYDNYED